MKNKKWIVPFAAILAFVLTAPSISAHVTLHPEKSSTDAFEKYTVRVPVEKEMHTTKLELKVPEDVDLLNVMPKDGWDYDLEKDDDGIITSVTWIATDGGIGPDEFTEFYFVGANPSDSTEVSWEAYQTYEDDSVVEWNGDPDSDEPASVTKVVEGDAEAEHDSNAGTMNETAAVDNEEPGDRNSSMLPIVLSSIAILLAVISLFRKRN